MGLERDFQPKVIAAIKNLFPGCIVIKNDPAYIQGLPDLLILFKKHWAMLEVKQSLNSPHRPNQDYYIKKLNEMSFASFVYPENLKEVLNGLQQAFES